MTEQGALRAGARRDPDGSPPGVSELCSIPISKPDLTSRERSYLLDAFDSSWISSTGDYVSRFETAFARHVGAAHAVSCCNGTAALHLALRAIHIEPGDEVIVPALTYVATANAVTYCGAEPVFADCNPQTWTLDPASVARVISDRTRAIIAVHLLGMPADMGALASVARDHNLWLIEDAAEAHGASYRGARVGSLGHVSTFSFYGNKIVTTGEGGMVCTGVDEVARRVRLLRGQGVRPGNAYWFDEIGFNYRMTNLACAIGLAQLERIDEMIARRAEVQSWYEEEIRSRGLPVSAQATTPGASPVVWMYAVTIDDSAAQRRDETRQTMARAGVETRPMFPALHRLPIHACRPTDADCPESVRVGDAGIMLPTHGRLTREDVRRVIDAIEDGLGARHDREAHRMAAGATING